MSTEKIPLESKQLDKFVEAEPMEATITFDIPAYKDKVSGDSFKRVLKVPTKKAYAVFKRLVNKQMVK